MYSRDSCIHLCATMVHICIHIHGKMHLILSHACVWQDSFIHVTMNHAHVWDDPDTHIEYYSVIHSSLHIHFCCFIMLNPYPCICKHHIFNMTRYFELDRDRELTNSGLCVCMHIHVDLMHVCDRTLAYMWQWIMHMCQVTQIRA